MQERPTQAPPDPDALEALELVSSRLVAGAPLFGARLFVLGSGPVEVRGARGAVFALDESGTAVLVVILPRVGEGAGADIADELDRMAQVPPSEIVPGPAADDAEIADRHAAFFDLADADRPGLGNSQKAFVVVADPPDVAAWEELLVEVGAQLAGVHLARGDVLEPLEVPEELRRERTTRVPVVLIAAGLLLIGVGVVLALRLRGEEAAPPAAVPEAPSAVRDVVAGVPGAATHNQWIGQDHLVRTSDGRMLAVYGGESGLQIVADNADHGRTWGAPATVAEIRPVSSSVAIDPADRLHVVFSDGSAVSYAVVEQRRRGWVSGPILELDPSTATPYVHVAYDDASGAAHVVWVEDAAAGQAPRWAAVGGRRNRPRVLAERRLAPPADEIPVLVTVAADPSGRVVATYRRGDSPFGWWARAMEAHRGGFTWGDEEQVPTEEGIGAADVALDDSGVAHLVLRDSTSFQLLYFTRGAEGEWSQGETAVDADATEEIDFPSLTLDRASRVIYLFFQNNRVQPQTGVLAAVRDPVTGWEAPFPAAASAQIAEGAFYPASLPETHGVPAVLWTRGGGAAALQVGVVVP